LLKIVFKLGVSFFSSVVVFVMGFGAEVGVLAGAGAGAIEGLDRVVEGALVTLLLFFLGQHLNELTL